MGRKWFIFLSAWIAGILLAACNVVPGFPTEETVITQVPVASEAASEPLPSATLPPTTATPLPTATVTLVPSPTNTPVAPEADLHLEADDVFVYPVPRLYSGDSVTFQVLAEVPEVVSPGDVVVRLQVADRVSVEGGLSAPTLAGDSVGLFTWAWETQGEVGEFPVTITLDPEDKITVGDANPHNNQVTLMVPVLPATARPASERNASWITAESACCTLHVVSGTAAHRDLNQLKAMADAAVQQAAAQLGVQPQAKMDLYLVDRVIGQGGYAGSNVVISYLDRNYVGEGIYEVLVHETVHLLDQQFASGRFPFLAEGLAVWVTGGHYKQHEDITQRLVALRALGQYIELPELVDDFYHHQHEIGYLEAAGFVTYLVDTYGWERVQAFYGDVSGHEEEDQVAVLDNALQAHFGQTLAEVEAAWLAQLAALPPDPLVQQDVATTIRYYDLVRSYQLQFDPTAHFLQAWLPFPQELEQRQLTAELTRHPEAEVNVTLEVMLHAVDQAIRAGDYEWAKTIMNSVERALASGGVFMDPLGRDYQRIVRKLSGVGYEVHQVDIDGTQAIVQVTEGRRVYLQPVTMIVRNQAWVLVN